MVQFLFYYANGNGMMVELRSSVLGDAGSNSLVLFVTLGKLWPCETATGQILRPAHLV